jgi:hypothetical protein
LEWFFRPCLIFGARTGRSFVKRGRLCPFANRSLGQGAAHVVSRLRPYPLTTEAAHRTEERSKLEEAVAFLRTLLADGPRPTGVSCFEAQIAEIARRTLQRALGPAGVRQRRTARGSEQMWELEPGRKGEK